MIYFATPDALREHLDSLNYDAGIGSAAIVVGGSLWLAYGTDPDGEWYFESGDPLERVSFPDGYDFYYERIGFDFLGPRIEANGVEVIWPRASESHVSEEGADRG
jgi:hypothetical protein